MAHARLETGLVLVLQLTSSLAWAGEPANDGPIVTGANNVGWSSAGPVLPASAEMVSPQALGQEASGAQAAASPPIAQAQVLTPIQGPLNLEGRYLGDISGEVGLHGGGNIDAVRLMDLLRPVASPALVETLSDRVGGRQRVALSELSSELFSLTFDTLSLSFEARLGAEARALRRIAFGQIQTVNPTDFQQPADFSVAANLSLGQTYDHVNQSLAGLRGSSDILANWGGFDGVTLSAGFDFEQDSDQRFGRHEIRATRDFFGPAIRVTAGEFFPTATGFQGSDRILGMSVGRAFSVIRPFQNVRPAGRREFVLDRAAFVEVEVNGVVVERLRLDPGPYALSDFPFAQGANSVRLLIDDVLGRRELVQFDLYGGASLLDVGITDFGVSAGVVQEGGEFSYDGTPAVSAYVRRGMTDTLSLGAYGQWVDRRLLAGGTATWGSEVGLLELGLAASRDDVSGKSGYAASLDYVGEFSAFDAKDTRFILTSQVLSRDFQDAFERTARNPQAWRVAGQLTSRLRRYTVNLGAAFTKGRDGQSDERAYDLSIGRSFGRFGVSLSLSRREIEFRDAETRVGFSLTLGLGNRWNAQARYDSGDSYREILVRRSPSGELNDVSGGVRLSRDEGRDAFGGDLRYINNRFEAELISNRLAARLPGGPTTQESAWRASTLLAYADGSFGIGRPAREGFILARRHPSLKGSSLALTDGNGRAIARAGWFGPAVAPIDRGYGVQRLELDVDPLPTGYDLGSGVVSAFPGYGNGYAITVGSDASRTVVGYLIKPDGSPAALVSGQIWRVGADNPADAHPFFTNRAGRFVGDGLAPGRYRLVDDDRVVAEFEVPSDREGMIDVGRIQISKP